MLSSEDITIKRNAMSILKIVTKCDHSFEDGHCIYCFKPTPKAKHRHDWDVYGKCTECSLWAHEACTLNHDHEENPEDCIYHD